MCHDRHEPGRFSSQARPELLNDVRRIAAEEGHQFQSVLDEALSEWAERKTGQTPRAEVIAYANTGGWTRADLLH